MKDAKTPYVGSLPPSSYLDRRAFTAAGLDRSTTIALWQQYMSEVHYKLDIEAGANESVECRLAKRGFAQLAISTFEAGAQRLTRSKRAALEDNVESFCLAFPTSGQFTCRQRGRESVALSGDVYLVNASEAYEIDVSEGSAVVAVSLPCDLLRERVRGIDDLCAAGQFADGVMASTLRHLLRGAMADMSGTDPQRLQDLCIDMIDLMMQPGMRRHGHAAAVGGRLADAARVVIVERCTDNAFDLAAAARACATSPRRLQDAFKLQATNFGRELLLARLRAAARMLRAPEEAGRQIGEVAAGCGFASQAHFATRYREFYGRSPSDERRPWLSDRSGDASG